MFKKAEDADIFPLPLLTGLRFQASAKQVEFFRQLPFGEGSPEIETVRTLLGNRQVVNRIVMRPVASPVAFVNGDAFAFDEKADRVDPADDGELLMRMFAGHGIIVPVETDERE